MNHRTRITYFIPTVLRFSIEILTCITLYSYDKSVIREYVLDTRFAEYISGNKYMKIK